MGIKRSNNRATRNFVTFSTTVLKLLKKFISSTTDFITNYAHCSPLTLNTSEMKLAVLWMRVRSIFCEATCARKVLKIAHKSKSSFRIAKLQSYQYSLSCRFQKRNCEIPKLCPNLIYPHLKQQIYVASILKYGELRSFYTVLEENTHAKAIRHYLIIIVFSKKHTSEHTPCYDL